MCASALATSMASSSTSSARTTKTHPLHRLEEQRSCLDDDAMVEAFRIAVDSYSSNCRQEEDNNDDESILNRSALLIHLLNVSHQLALYYTQQRAYQQVIHYIQQALDKLRDFEQRSLEVADVAFESKSDADANDSIVQDLDTPILGGPLLLLKIELCLLYAKAQARLRDSQKASTMLRECRRLIQTHTPYKSVTDYQQQQQRRHDKLQPLQLEQTISFMRPNHNPVRHLADPARAAAIYVNSQVPKDGCCEHVYLCDFDSSTPAPDDRLPSSRPSRTTEIGEGLFSDLSSVPIAVVEFVRDQLPEQEPDDDLADESTKQPPQQDYSDTSETYSGDSSDSESFDVPQSDSAFVEPVLLSVPERASNIAAPRFPTSPTIKSCLRNTGNYSSAFSLADGLESVSLAVTDSFASFACRSTLSALAAGVNDVELPLSPLSPATARKRVSFSLVSIQQQEDDERQTLLRAFVPRQKLRMLRDQRTKAKVVVDVECSPLPPPPHDETSVPISHRQRIEELSLKLRQAEEDARNSPCRTRMLVANEVERLEHVNDNESISISVTSSSSSALNPTRAAKALTIFAGYVASAFLRP